VADPAEPVSKRTSGVLVLDPEHSLVARKIRSMEREVHLARAVCCQCRMCTDLCPRYNLGHDIEPHLAMRSLVTDGLVDAPTAHVTAAYLCCLCGVCEVYACPLFLSPRRVYGELRDELARAGQKNPHRRNDCTPDEFHKARRIPLPRLIARLGLSEYMEATDVIELAAAEVASVRIPLSQHIGAPARPVVTRGDAVRAGQLIGEIPEGKLGARIHASIDGIVVEVDEHEIEIRQRT
jgi:Na+-translocating ferredoxin:NAD+ oxidoreductase RnfC subunit